MTRVLYAPWNVFSSTIRCMWKNRVVLYIVLVPKLHSGVRMRWNKVAGLVWHNLLALHNPRDVVHRILWSLLHVLFNFLPRILKSRASLRNISRPLSVVRGEWKYTASSRSWIDATRYTSQEENIAFPLQRLPYSRSRKTPSFITAGLTADSLT